MAKLVDCIKGLLAQLTHEIDEKFPLIVNGVCIINVRTRSGLPGLPSDNEKNRVYVRKAIRRHLKNP